MIGRSKPPDRGTWTCCECSVRIGSDGSSICRCCAADSEPLNSALNADTVRSPYLMAPVPDYPVESRRNFPRLETTRLLLRDGSEIDAAVWWKAMGTRWIPQHPLEYPRNRLRSRNDWGLDSAPLDD